MGGQAEVALHVSHATHAVAVIGKCSGAAVLSHAPPAPFCCQDRRSRNASHAMHDKIK